MRVLANAALLGVALLTFAAPAAAEFALSGYGEFGASIGPAAQSLSLASCYETNPRRCGSALAHDSLTPKSLLADLHVAATVSEGWQLQFDAEVNRGYMGSHVWGRNTERTTTYGTGLHLDRLTTDGRLGVFVSVGNSDWGQMANRLVSTGLEGEWFLGNTSLFSQYVHSRAIAGHEASFDLYSNYLDAGARHFLTDNLMLQGDFGAGLSESKTVVEFGRPGNISQTALKWGGKVEYRLEVLPLSVAFDYRGSYAAARQDYRGVMAVECGIPLGTPYEGSITHRRVENLFRITLRYFFGPESLIANDRTGAAMTDRNPWYGENPVTRATAGRANLLPDVTTVPC